MKKKFSIWIMLVACVFAGGTALVSSCSDEDTIYDDSSVLSRLSALESTTSSLQSAIDAGAVITSVTATSDGIVVKLSDGSSYTITNGTNGTNGADGKDGADGANGTVWSIGDDGYWYCDGVKTDYYALGTKGDKGDTGETGATGATGAAGADGTDGGYYKPNPDTGTFWYYTSKDDEGEDTGIVYVATAEDAITAVWDSEEGTLTFTGVDGIEGGIVKIYLTSELKSLVFQPEFYYQGIQAFGLFAYNYTALEVKTVSADDDCSTDKPSYKVDAGNPVEISVVPDMTATYHLNPSNAKMSEDVSAYNFLAYNKKYTRASDSELEFTITEADLTSEEGMVTIHAQYTGADIKDIDKDGEVTVLALQYKYEQENTRDEVTVTSDYAAVKATTYTKLVLNYALGTPAHDVGDTHLYQTAADAIAANSPIYKVLWSEDSLDLRTLVNTHLTPEGGSCEAWDVDATDGTAAKAGFKYSFELVGWTAGGNITSQSAHAVIYNDYLLRPQVTKDGKQQPDCLYSEENPNNGQSLALVGRQPLVRVILTDTINNEIAAVGYLKLEIVASDPTTQTNSFDMDVTYKEYTLACSGDVNLQTLKWYDVEEKILAELNMSKDEFEAKYELDGGTTDADQFEDNKESSTARTDKIGTISQTTTDLDGTMTEVLMWTIGAQEAYTLLKNATAPYVTYVRYKLTSGTADYDYVYIKFTWDPTGNINIDPEYDYNLNKIEKYWYAENSTSTGTYEIHTSVETVGTTPNIDGTTTPVADCELVADIKATLMNNTLEFEFDAPYDGLSNDVTVTLAFVGGTAYDGKKLYPNADGTELHSVATSQTKATLIATLDPTTGVIKYAENTKYIDDSGNKTNINDVAYEYLNAAGHDQLEHSVTATIGVSAKVCTDGYDVTVTNKEFDVVFLRPINIVSAGVSFTDGLDAGDKQDVKIAFTDWRDEWNDGTSGTYNYYDYYGIKSIAVDIAGATTDMAGGEKLLSNVTDKIKLYWSGDIDDTDHYDSSSVDPSTGKWGSITYENNGQTIQDCTIYIPIKITYYWGVLEDRIEATVAKTKSNAPRH